MLDLSAKVQIKSGPNSLPTLFFVGHEHFRVHPIIRKVILALLRYLRRCIQGLACEKHLSYLGSQLQMSLRHLAVGDQNCGSVSSLSTYVPRRNNQRNRMPSLLGFSHSLSADWTACLDRTSSPSAITAFTSDLFCIPRTACSLESETIGQYVGFENSPT